MATHLTEETDKAQTSATSDRNRLVMIIPKSTGLAGVSTVGPERRLAPNVDGQTSWNISWEFARLTTADMAELGLYE